MRKKRGCKGALACLIALLLFPYSAFGQDEECSETAETERLCALEARIEKLEEQAAKDSDFALEASGESLCIGMFGALQSDLDAGQEDFPSTLEHAVGLNFLPDRLVRVRLTSLYKDHLNGSGDVIVGQLSATVSS